LIYRLRDIVDGYAVVERDMVMVGFTLVVDGCEK
jgi:hypothetical protein